MTAKHEGNGKCPMTQKELLDHHFMENRSHLLDVAAFLDRMDRAVKQNGTDDFRFTAFKQCLADLQSEAPYRTDRLLMMLSDPRSDLLEERDKQSADGAPNPEQEDL